MIYHGLNRNKRPGKATVRITPNGRFFLSAKAMQKTELAPNQHVLLGQDGQQWYLVLTQGAGLPIKSPASRSQKSPGGSFYHRDTAQAILTELESPEGITLAIGGATTLPEGYTAYPVITAPRLAELRQQNPNTLTHKNQ